MKNKKNLTSIVIVLLIAAVISGYLVYFEKINLPQKVNQAPTSTSVTDKTSNRKVYTNTKYGYSVKYPDNWYIKDTTFQAQESDSNVLDDQIFNDQPINDFKERKINMSYASIIFDKSKSLLNYGDGGLSYKSEILEQSEIGGNMVIKAISTHYEYDWQNQKNIETGKYYKVLISANNGKSTIFLNSDLDQKDIADQILSTLKFTQ